MMMLRAYHVQWTICIVCIVKVSLVTVIICAFHSAPHSGSLLGVDFCVSFSKAQTQSFNEMNWRRSIGSKLFNLKKKHRITVQDGKTNQSREKKSPALLIWSEHNQFLELQFSQKPKIVIPKANKREHVNWSTCHVMVGHFSPYFFPIWSAWIKPNYKYWYHHAAKAIRQTFWFKFNKRDYFMFRIITNKKRDDGERTVWFSERKWAHREPFM